MAEPVKRREPVSKYQWMLAAAGVVMIGAAVWMTAIHRRPPSVPPPPAQSIDRASLPMYVQHDGAALRLHWDPDADAIRRASTGTLFITDGPRQSQLNLTPEVLRSGVASYWPESSGVTFRLQLDGAPAGEIQAPATAARQEPRPSPFGARPAAPPPRRAVVEEPDDGLPKPYTVRAMDTPAPPPHSGAADTAAAPSPVRPASAAAPAPRAVVAPPPPARDADRAVKSEQEKPPAKPSRWHRMTRKIPLLRRLGSH